MPVLLAAAAAVAGIPLLQSCENTPRGSANERPVVQIMDRAGSIPYRFEFHWSGWDSDGLVDHYQFAVDIPDSIPFNTINDPHSTVVAWRDTSATSVAFVFATPDIDPAAASGGAIVLRTEPPAEGGCSGVHSLYVRAVDNEGAVSPVDYVSFTAHSVMPRTTLFVPCAQFPVGSPGAGYTRAGRHFAVGWSGSDSDGPALGAGPAHWEWKLVGVGPLNPFALPAVEPILAGPGAAVPWTRIEPGITALGHDLESPGNFLFALRAVDEAGCPEVRFTPGRNALFIDSEPQFGVPALTIREPTLGIVAAPGGGSSACEVATTTTVQFEIDASAAAYCGAITGYNWGVDVANPDDDSQLHGWSTDPRTDRLTFPSAGVHTLVFKARDAGGGVAAITVLLKVIAFSGDRELLYVDDFRLASWAGVTDAAMDERVAAMFEAAGIPRSEQHQFDVWGAGDAGGAPEVPTLADLARYKLVYWSVNGAGVQGKTALSEALLCGCPVLAAYLGGGGQVWISGWRVVGATTRWEVNRDPGQPCNSYALHYNELDAIQTQPEDFVCQVLALCDADIRTVVQRPATHGLIAARPTSPAAADLFPRLAVDSTFATAAVSGIPYVDALFSPVFTPGGGLDTLYVLEPSASNSIFRLHPCAFRYAPPGAVPAHGAVALFGFPPELMKPGSAADRSGTAGMARSMVEWFRVHRGANP